MPDLVIAAPLGPPESTDSLRRLVSALQAHGYRVVVVEAPAEPTLARLVAQQMFVAYELTVAASSPQPLVIRLCHSSTQMGQAHRLDIQFLAAPASLRASVQWLIKHTALLLPDMVPYSPPVTGCSPAAVNLPTLYSFLPPAQHFIQYFAKAGLH